MNPLPVLTESGDGLLLITINRPRQLNALNRGIIEALGDVLERADADPAIRVAVVTGAGDKAFVAGADIKEFAGHDQRRAAEMSAHGHRVLFDRMERLSKPVIAAINGYALGGGLELAMSAHMRIASESARLGLPEVSLGVIPCFGGTQRLARLVGRGKALELITTGGTLDAQEALQWGLVNRVVPKAELLTAARAMAAEIMQNAPTAIAAAIRAVNAGFQDGLNGFEVEIEEFGKCFTTQDFREGTRAFMEKRKPRFPGR
jgi:enoyl-CoA hydratase